jgi:hypothetical protein
MDRKKPLSSNEAIPTDSGTRRDPELDDELDVDETIDPEPPRTTTRHMTSPKFGSAGSGGAELEPGPER